MASALSVGSAQRKALLRLYRRHPDPAVRLRAHIILLLAEGHPWSLITSALFCSSRTIDCWKQRFEEDGLDALFGGRRSYGYLALSLLELLQPRHSKNRVEPFAVDGHCVILIQIHALRQSIILITLISF